MGGNKRRIKMYFDVVYGGGRRRYGGAGRDSPQVKSFLWSPSSLVTLKAIASCTRSIVTGTRRFFKNPIMPLSSSLLKIFNGECATDENIRNA